MLNVCADRYQFTVALAACLMSERISLLPSTHTPQVIAQLAAFAPDVFCLTDDRRCDIELARVYYPDLLRPSTNLAVSPFDVPRIAASQLAAIVFTSGSTGTPVPYKKTWGLLVALRSKRGPAPGLVGRQEPCPHRHGTRPAHVWL